MSNQLTEFDTRTPCECGSFNAHWYGDRYGLNRYLCDKCASEWIKKIERSGELLIAQIIHENIKAGQ